MSSGSIESSGSAPARIRAADVHVVHTPVIVGAQATPQGAITLAPVLGDGRIQALRIRCACGNELAVECVYADEAAAPAEAAPTDSTTRSEP